MTWWTYVKEIARDDTQTDIARKLDISQAAVSRWSKTMPSPENVTAFAKAYQRPVIEAFIAAGFLSKEDAEDTHIFTQMNLGEVSSDALVDEIAKRLKGTRQTSPALESKSGLVSQTPEPIDLDNVDIESLGLAAYKAPNEGRAVREKWNADVEGSQDPEDYT